MTEHKLIGHCAVDSGQIIIVDPCYVREGLDYEKVMKTTYPNDMDTTPPCGGEMTFSGTAGNGIACGGFGGDGTFPVHAEVSDDGLVLNLTITFDGPITL